jgi:hypothetical protein
MKLVEIRLNQLHFSPVPIAIPSSFIRHLVEAATEKIESESRSFIGFAPKSKLNRLGHIVSWQNNCRRQEQYKRRTKNKERYWKMRLPLAKTVRPVILVVFFFAVIGVVSPFALGNADAGICVLQPKSNSQKAFYGQPRSIVALSTVTSPGAELNTTPKSRIRRILSNFNPSPGKKDGRWKGGESKATLASRLVFSYVGPLLDLAKNRTLTEADCFEVSESLKMEHSVDTLAECYDCVKRTSQKQIELKRAKGADVVKNSQSLLLLKALLKYHRKTLIWTGVLRLGNTLVQAFPAILVARLLRSIEAGDAYPVSRAVWSAVSLMAVLTLKMITENQFFHWVLTMATQTRGTLEGLIFDKSLRLPDGGSGVLAKRDKDKERKALGLGGVLNLMQTDANTIELAAMQVHTLWDGPLQVSEAIKIISQIDVRIIDSPPRRLQCIHRCCSNIWVQASSGGLQFS